MLLFKLILFFHQQCAMMEFSKNQCQKSYLEKLPVTGYDDTKALAIFATPGVEGDTKVYTIHGYMYLVCRP